MATFGYPLFDLEAYESVFDADGVSHLKQLVAGSKLEDPAEVLSA